MTLHKSLRLFVVLGTLWAAATLDGYLFTRAEELAKVKGADTEKKPEAQATLGGNFEVESIKDIAYFEGENADPAKHKLDLYVPKGQKDFPVLFFVHGGGWTSGDRKLYGKLGQVFAKNGIGTVIISYRLSPKVQHPAHIEDVAKAFAWTVRNIGKYGGNVDQIFVSGHSAGGHLSALLATDERYLKAEKLTLNNIKGALLLSGVYTIVNSTRFNNIFGKDEEVVRDASPMRHVKEKLPPFLIVYADKDFPSCDKMSEAFCQAIQKHKGEASTVKVEDRTHISIIVKLMSSDTDPATVAMLEFIAKHSGRKLLKKDS